MAAAAARLFAAAISFVFKAETLVFTSLKYISNSKQLSPLYPGNLPRLSEHNASAALLFHHCCGRQHRAPVFVLFKSFFFSPECRHRRAANTAAAVAAAV